MRIDFLLKGATDVIDHAYDSQGCTIDTYSKYLSPATKALASGESYFHCVAFAPRSHCAVVHIIN